MYHSAPRPEVLKPPSGAVIAFVAVLTHSSSAVIAFYEDALRGYVWGYWGYLIHYTNIVPPYRIH